MIPHYIELDFSKLKKSFHYHLITLYTQFGIHSRIFVAKGDSCKQKIIHVRSEYSYSGLDVDSKSMIQMDLCGYLRDRLNAYAITHTESPTPEFDKLCVVVFSIPQTPSFQKWFTIKSKSKTDPLTRR